MKVNCSKFIFELEEFDKNFLFEADCILTRTKLPNILERINNNTIKYITTYNSQWVYNEDYILRYYEIVSLAQALRGNNSFLRLELSLNNLKNESAIAKTLEKNNTLAILNLSFNQIGLEGAKFIAQALKVNTSLNWISLANNNINDEGVIALADSLTTNNTLKTLYLQCNNINERGAKAIAESLKINNTLRILFLNSNKIANGGATSIIESLKNNNSLTALNINDNGINEACKNVVNNILAKNNTLTYLDISHPNCIWSSDELIKLFKHNYSLIYLNPRFQLTFDKEGNAVEDSVLPTIQQNGLKYIKIYEFMKKHFFKGANFNVKIEYKDFFKLKIFQKISKPFFEDKLNMLQENGELILNIMEDYINEHYFELRAICKKINSESIFACLPKDVFKYFVSFLGYKSLWNEIENNNALQQESNHNTMINTQNDVNYIYNEFNYPIELIGNSHQIEM